jgi:anaerobic selenocysteine-containing dehydrogenase
MAESRTVRSYCRTCLAACGVLLELEGDRVVKVRGDPDHPLSRGYTCPKGRAMGALHHHPERLDEPLLRRAGELEPSSWAELLADLSGRVAALRERHGDSAFGIYIGTGAGYDSLGLHSARTLAPALGTRSLYSAMTIDTPCLPLVAELMSGAPVPNPVLDPESARMTLILGSNPSVSHGHTTAWPNPASMLRTLAGEGRELWVVDPRETATARQATRHLAIRPASDHALLAYLVRELLGPDGGADREHLAAHALDVDRLEAAVAPWGLERACALTGLHETDLAELLASIRRYGRLAVMTGTGTSMQRHANVIEWLSWALQIVTGSFERPGGMWFHPAASTRFELMGEFPEPVFRAAPGPASRPEISGHLEGVGERPCSAIIDEIEAGNLRGLLVLGGNPMTAFPNTPRIASALRSLDVLAVAELVATDVTKIATHVLPSTGPLERMDIPGYMESAQVEVISQIATPVFEPQANRRPLWWMLARIGESLGVKILPGGASADDVTQEQLMREQLRGGRVDYDALVNDPAPAVVLEDVRDRLRGWVEDKLPQGRWRLAPAPLVAQLEAISDTPPPPLRLISGRQLRQMNSALRDTAGPGERLDTARIHLHAQDAAAAGIVDGEPIRVSSATGSLEGVAKIDTALRQGAVWVPHGWPELSVSALTSERVGVDPLTGMVEQSGLAVRIQALAR